MSELFQSITNFGSALIVHWWALIPGLLLTVAEIARLLFDGVDEWFNTNKNLIKRYAIPISLAGLFIASFMAFHEERIAHEKTKAEINEKGINSLKAEIESLRDEMHKWPTEGSLDGNVQPISVSSLNEIALFDNDPQIQSRLESKTLGMPFLSVGPVIIRNNTSKEIVVNIYLKFRLEGNDEYSSYPAISKEVPYGELSGITEYLDNTYGKGNPKEYLFNPVNVPANRTAKGILVFIFGIDRNGAVKRSIFNDKENVKLEFFDAFTKKQLINPITALTGGFITNTKGE